MPEKQSKFWKASEVHAECEKMQAIERVRAQDRAWINNQFNGGRPYTSAEEEEYQIQINVNWLEGTRILMPAVNQLNNALIFKERFFSATSKKGKIEKRGEYGETFSTLINEALKTGSLGKRHMSVMMDRNSSVALHGIGPTLWLNSHRCRCRYVPLEDLLIPTDTYCDLSNLVGWAVNLYPTVGELFDMTHGEKVDKNWKMTTVNKILDDLISEAKKGGSNDTTFEDQPEKRAEWFKQNRCMYDTDSAPTAKLRMFFYKNPETKDWRRCVLLREPTPSVRQDPDEFLYDGQDTPFAKSIDHILHVQYGDNSLVAPRKLHSVRGLGVMLYPAVECMNRLRCETVQHVLFQLKTLLRRLAPSDRDMPKMMDLSQYSILEDGWDFVKAQDRYGIDPRLIEFAQAQMRQIMQESGSSYVQKLEGGESSQPITAKEASILQNQANIAVSAMLQLMYEQETFFYQEIVRRFCDENSEDDEVKHFREECIEDGIPRELMKASNWTVRIERALGAGDNFIANQEATQLMQLSPQLDPKSQRIVKRLFVTTTTRNPAMGKLLVPDAKEEQTDGTLAAENIFGTLYEGIPLQPREGIERTDYIEALIGMMGAKIQGIQSLDNMGTPADLTGLQTVGTHISQNLQILEQDKSEKQNLKLYSDELGKQMNELKGFAQRQQQKAEADAKAAQADPEAEAKVQAIVAQAQAKMQISEATTQQKMAHKEAAFEQKMAHAEKNFETKISQMLQNHQVELQKAISQMQTEIMSKGATTGADVASTHAKANASVEASKKVAKAKPVEKA